MKKSEAVSLFKSLSNFNETENLEGVKLAYAVSRNIDLLKPEIIAIEKTLEFSEKFQKFHEDHVKLVDKYTVKDEEGNNKKKEIVNADGTKREEPVIFNRNKLEKEFEALKKQHKEAVESREKQQAEYNKLLTEESEVSLHKVKKDDLPEKMTNQQMEKVFGIIEE